MRGYVETCPKGQYPVVFPSAAIAQRVQHGYELAENLITLPFEVANGFDCGVGRSLWSVWEGVFSASRKYFDLSLDPLGFKGH